MGTFRYYLPKLELRGAARLSPAQVRDRGLGDRLDDCVTGQLAQDRFSQNNICGGPDGGEGLLIVPMPADGGTVERSGYDPDHQTWTKSGGGDYWIGVDRDHPPTPAGLQRRELVAGYDHELGDGHIWSCPTIRRAMFLPAVPCSYAKVSGALIREPLPQYAPIFQRTLQYAALYACGEVPPQLEQWELAVACLALNYRVGDEEVSALRLLNDRSLNLVMEAAFDLPWLREATDGSDPEKKRAWDSVLAALAPTAPGEAGSFPTTSPPPPI